jgi:hypothetical protein
MVSAFCATEAPGMRELSASSTYACTDAAISQSISRKQKQKTNNQSHLQSIYHPKPHESSNITVIFQRYLLVAGLRV